VLASQNVNIPRVRAHTQSVYRARARALHPSFYPLTSGVRWAEADSSSGQAWAQASSRRRKPAILVRTVTAPNHPHNAAPRARRGLSHIDCTPRPKLRSTCTHSHLPLVQPSTTLADAAPSRMRRIGLAASPPARLYLRAAARPGVEWGVRTAERRPVSK
jgi:hypothetical protein